MKTKKMRKFVLAACLSLAAVALLALGASFTGKGSKVAMAATAADCTTESGLILEAAGGEYTVTGCTDAATVIDIPDEYNGVKITAVADEAFNSNQNITRISLGSNIKTLGASAFYNCRQVIEVYYDVVTTGDYTASTTPFGSVGSDPDGNTNPDITIGKDVERIGAYLFYYAGWWETYGGSLRFEEGSVCSEIGASAFKYAALSYMEVPSSVTKVGDNAFWSCDVEEFYFDATLDGAYTSSTSPFYSCGEERCITFTIGKDVKSLPEYFSAWLCDGYEGGRVVFESPSKCEKIGAYAFYYCRATYMEVPSSVTEIGEGAFYSCGDVLEFYFDADLPDYTSSTNVFHLLGYYSSSNNTCTITIGKDVTRISEYCFYGLGGIGSDISVTFESGSACTEIAAHAFEKTYITSVNIESVMVTIGERAFYGCTYLKTVNFNAVACDDFGQGGGQFDGIGSKYGAVTINVGSAVTRIPAYFLAPYDETGSFTKASKSSVDYKVVYAGSKVKEIGDYAFAYAYMSGVSNEDGKSYANGAAIPSSIKHIGVNAFLGGGLLRGFFYDPENWYVSKEEDGVMKARLSSSDLSDKETAATLLSSTYAGYHWYKGDDFKYELAEDGKSYTATKYVGLGGDVEISSKHDSVTVAAVGEMCVYGFTSVTSVTIPSSVLTIGAEAFSGCTKLATLTIEGSSLEAVGGDAFYGCAKLTKIYADTLSSLFSADYENAYANPVMLLSSAGGTLYIDESKTTDITAKTNSGLTYIGSYAFAYCTIFTDMTLSEGLTHVGAHAFEGMDGLDSFVLGSFSGWSVYDEGGNIVGKITATELKTDALGYFTSTYLSYTWERAEVTGVAPTIDCVVESGGYTNGDIVIYTTVDSESSIDCIVYVTPSGEELSVGAMTLTLYAKDLVCGLYVFYAVDVNGLESDEYCITFDDAAPEIYATGSDVWGGYVGSEFSVYAKDFDDLSPVTLWYSRDGESWLSCGGDSYSVTPSGDSGNDGKYWFAARDAAGNKVGAYWIVLDTLAPSGEWKFTDDLSLYFSWDAPSYTTWTCTVNGESYTKGMTYRKETTYTAVLTSPTGNTETVACELGHAYEEEYIEPTCQKDGYWKYTCVYCGDTQTESDPYSSTGDHNYVLELVEPTCYSSGYSQYVCTDCAATTGYQYIAQLDHQWVDDPDLYTDPTCTTNGFRGKVCRLCGATDEYGEYLPATGHDFISDEDFYVDATCTERGQSREICVNCGEVRNTVYTAELGHLLVTESHTATCTTPGYSKSYCTREGCDYESTDDGDQILAAHSWSSEPYDMVSSTCEGEGYVVYVCDVCGEKETVTLSPSGHTWVYAGETTIVGDDGEETAAFLYECSKCGATKVEAYTDAKEAGNAVTELFEKYQKYIWWILLALVVVWSLFIGLRWALQRNDQERAKTRSMLANYVLGIFVIAVIVVGLPYLVYGIAILVG